MKKVGIVSCYYVPNYGSMLQAYATQKALDKLGYSNENINIDGFKSTLRKRKIKYFLKASLTSDILLSKAGRAVNVLKRKFNRNEYGVNNRKRRAVFGKFKEDVFKVSKQYASMEEISSEYSAIMIGSDQMWLPANIAADYHTLNWVPKDKNTIAYATSFGQSQLPKDIEKKASAFLPEIKHIGVREESGQKLVYKLTKRNVPIVCDPTLLFTGDEWMEIQKKEPIIREPYILCYFLGNNRIHRTFAKRLKEKTGCKIVVLPHIDEYVKSDEEIADIMKYEIDPADFLNLIRNAEYVCTDSFHCSVFSILYRKRFFTFKRFKRKTKSSTNTRLNTLFNITGISQGPMNGDEDMETCIDQNIDYDDVHAKLEVLRKQSFQYLMDSIEDIGSTDL